MLLLALLVSSLLPSLPAYASTPLRPVIFVHGSAGSAAQFETQAKRLAANGYPIEIIEAHEYDSPNIATILPEVYAGLDARISRLLADTGATQVDLIAHSLGTFVSQGYLNSSPSRAGRVAHYVNLDGRTAAAPPGGVDTLAIWGEGDATRAVIGARNVSLPDQSHTQTVSSVESFRAVFRFLRDRDPRTTAVVPTAVARVSGRAVIFPSNVGAGGVVKIFDVTLGRFLRHTVEVAADGSFGPVPLSPHARYEFVLVRPGTPDHHFYFQPFLRSDSFVRLLAGRPGEGVGALIETSPAHTALTLNRQKEWWASADKLYVNGRQILNEANAPRAKRVIGVFAFDKNSDRVTDLTAPLPDIYAQTFLTGMDVYIPARAFVSVVVANRDGRWESTILPAWPSDQHRVTINVNDY
ncbi:Lipase (class 2) [Paractinoplanes atraurantiacus]|uniref:Lipase (Class 2) n=2 Tax=Paractinoplanes atraurantiacus TaxID=1036182 RepID=A0A285KGL6_9ACTN|nr:Lipase (class 2) [Actinoplanes atraurantiacus]